MIKTVAKGRYGCLPVVIACIVSIAVSAETASTGKVVGTVKAVTGNVLTINSDAGGEIKVSVADSTRLLQLDPGQKDLKTATPVQLRDLQSGDRVLARGKLSDDGKSLDVSLVVVMKQTSISQMQQQEREDWQKNSVGGLVKTVDGSAGTVTVTVGAGPASRSVLIRTSKDTIVRRYAPDSVKFDDAKKSTLAEIKPGDQVRARGSRNADASEMSAQEIVSGSFKNIAGTVQAVNADEKTLTVMDLATKKSVTVKLTADSQMHQLPAMVAQRIAVRLKGVPVQAGAGVAGVSQEPATASAAPSGQGWNGHGGPGAGGNGNGGASDLQRMLGRTPTVTLADLKKGDAVMIVSTEGTADTAPTAITLLSGVEPILSASPDAAKGMTLSAWSLDSGGGADATAQ
jgi:transcription antitermination factor NusG